MLNRICRICGYEEILFEDLNKPPVNFPHFINLDIHVHNDITTTIHPDTTSAITKSEMTGQHIVPLIVCPKCGNITYNLERLP